MAKKRLPPAEFCGKPLHGPNLKSYTVGSWCPTSDGSGPPTAVAITLAIEGMPDIVMRLKTPARVDEMIQMLLRHKRDVWPDAQ